MTPKPILMEGKPVLLAAGYQNTADDCLYLSNAIRALDQSTIWHEVRETVNGRELWRDSYGMLFDDEEDKP